MAYRYLRRHKKLRVYDPDSRKLSTLAERASFDKTVSSQLILLCVPISAMEETLRKTAPLLREGQIVVDTCSVKVRPVEWMLAHLPDSVQILGTHPLFGPDSGKEGVAGLKIALCPVRINPEIYRQIREYLKSLQLILIETRPEEHDRQIAKSQAIFHFIAQAIKRLHWNGQAISTPGPEVFYRLVRTVQHDTKQLFLDLEQLNPNAAQYRQQFIQELVDLNSDLADSQSP